MRPLAGVLVTICLAAFSAKATTIDFEGLPKSNFERFGLDGVTLDGATFYDFKAAKASEINHNPPVPAHSGENVAQESYGDFPPLIEFNSPVNYVGGYFNYYNWFSPLCMYGYGAAGQRVGQTCSKYDDNVGADDPSPYAPNEYLSITSTIPIATLGFAYGDDDGFYYTIDDLTFATATPEPASVTLVVLAGLVGLFFASTRYIARLRENPRRLDAQI